jgi:hypothetical protein
MGEENASDLLRECAGALQEGADFPTVWNTMLKGHALVAGIPMQKFEGTRSLLVVPLVTGQWLLFDGDAKEFSLG